MAVDGLHVEAEGFQLLVNRIGTHDLGNIAVDLQAVVVDDDAEVVQLVMGGEHARLPDLPLLDLAVTQQGVDPVVPLF